MGMHVCMGATLMCSFDVVSAHVACGASYPIKP